MKTAFITRISAAGDNTLSVSGSDADATFKLTRMDTNDQIPNENGENTFAIPKFEGSLMFKIDGISGKDVQVYSYLLIW